MSARWKKSQAEIPASARLEAEVERLTRLLAEREAEIVALRARIVDDGGLSLPLTAALRGLVQGDLTAALPAETAADPAAVGAFNAMIEEIARTLSRLRDAAAPLQSSAEKSYAASHRLVEQIQAQAERLRRANAQAEGLTALVPAAQTGVAVGDSSIRDFASAMHQGRAGIDTLIEGLTHTQDLARRTNARLDRLQASAQEIDDISQLIVDAADRTGVLALNGSIQAAMAGDAGRGFAAVAEEIERLAQRATEAARQIGVLMRSFQTETAHAEREVAECLSGIIDGQHHVESTRRIWSEGEKLSSNLGDEILSPGAATRPLMPAVESLRVALRESSRETLIEEELARNMHLSLGELVEALAVLARWAARYQLRRSAEVGESVTDRTTAE